MKASDVALSNAACEDCRLWPLPPAVHSVQQAASAADSALLPPLFRYITRAFVRYELEDPTLFCLHYRAQPPSSLVGPLESTQVAGVCFAHQTMC